MQVKHSIVALGAIGTLMLFGGQSVEAKSVGTEKKDKPSSSSTKKIEKKVITVKSGDTLESIAKKNKTTYPRLFNANKHLVNPDNIDVGDKIRIPAKKEKLPNRMAQLVQAPVVQTIVSSTAAQAQTYTTQQYTSAPVSSESYYVGNGMWCTDYVQSKRPDVPIYGNAGYSWIGAAKADGKSTGSTPKAGAVAVTNGHVAYVEKVNKDGSYQVSEMGWNYQAGNYNKRTVNPGTFGGFIY